MSWSEARLHAWLARQSRPRRLAGSRMHDAAVLERIAKNPVACTDQCIEGVHFTRDVPPERVGRKAAARALSDLAATAARPLHVLLALSAPRDRDERWIQRAISGVRATAREHGADLVAGDLACARGPVKLAVTAIGERATRGRAPGRDRARAGQRVLVTGPLGGSLLGRHSEIRPRIEEGIWLASRGATALMDVSDGLALDLHRLARASRVRIDLDLDDVPIHRDAVRRARRTRRTPLDHALHDGEDHELIATASASDVDRIVRESARACPTLAVIGRVRAGSGVWLRDSRARARRFDPTEGGFVHGE